MTCCRLSITISIFIILLIHVFIKCLAPLCAGSKAGTGLEVGNVVSGALALISNCQITFAWVILRPDAAQLPLTSASFPIPPSYSFDLFTCIMIWQWTAAVASMALVGGAFLSAPQAQILKWCNSICICGKANEIKARHWHTQWARIGPRAIEMPKYKKKMPKGKRRKEVRKKQRKERKWHEILSNENTGVDFY